MYWRLIKDPQYAIEYVANETSKYVSLVNSGEFFLYKEIYDELHRAYLDLDRGNIIVVTKNPEEIGVLLRAKYIFYAFKDKKELDIFLLILGVASFFNNYSSAVHGDCSVGPFRDFDKKISYEVRKEVGEYAMTLFKSIYNIPYPQTKDLEYLMHTMRSKMSRCIIVHNEQFYES